MSQSTSLSDLTMAGLRDERTRCRRALELARLRSRHEGGPTADAIAGLRTRADALTEELIRRYAADLGLVDSLLEPACPQRAGSEPVSVEGGAVRSPRPPSSSQSAAPAARVRGTGVDGPCSRFYR